MFVYVIRNSATGKVYIGQHKGNNLKKYLQTKLSDAVKFRGGRSRLYNSMRKHPREVWSIEPLVEVQTKEELDRWERRLIALYDTRNPEVGYNICKGGEGFTGRHSSETRAKLSEIVSAWNADPANADTIMRRNRKLSENKKDYYADRWVMMVCPECGKSFSHPFWLARKVVRCSTTCRTAANKKNDAANKKREENRRKAMETPEYRVKFLEANRIALEKRRQSTLEAYNSNPNHCLNCGSVIKIRPGDKPSVIRKRKFCNHSCANKSRL